MRYTVVHDRGLYVVTGEIPLIDAECLGACWAGGLELPVYDWVLADVLNAQLVVGNLSRVNEKRHALGLPELKDNVTASHGVDGAPAAVEVRVASSALDVNTGQY